MTVARARQLRRRQTDAERLLWGRLRDRRLCGYKFRRQMPVGRFIADFVCEERKLVVEIDGSQHAGPLEADAVRTSDLENPGYRVIRFWNNQALQETDEVLTEILRVLEEGD